VARRLQLSEAQIEEFTMQNVITKQRILENLRERLQDGSVLLLVAAALVFAAVLSS
jgi:hypothetical protein